MGGGRLDPAKAARERRLTNHLNDYVDEVISHIRRVNSTMLFGPGEAKIEFKNRLENQVPGGNVVRLETVDRLSDSQIAAKVQQGFHTTHNVSTGVWYSVDLSRSGFERAVSLNPLMGLAAFFFGRSAEAVPQVN